MILNAIFQTCAGEAETSWLT